jgi:AraC-like DNA-binding protein
MRATRQIVDRASEFLRAHAGEGVRIGEVSRVAGISERTLRNAFRRERLEGVRQALRDGPPTATVTRIASQYGFFELGRFAAIYKNAFGESPSQTIKVRRTSRNVSSGQAGAEHLVTHD